MNKLICVDLLLKFVEINPKGTEILVEGALKNPLLQCIGPRCNRFIVGFGCSLNPVNVQAALAARTSSSQPEYDRPIADIFEDSEVPEILEIADPFAADFEAEDLDLRS